MFQEKGWLLKIKAENLSCKDPLKSTSKVCSGHSDAEKIETLQWAALLLKTN